MRLVLFADFDLMAPQLSKIGFAIKELGFYILLALMGLAILMVFYLVLYTLSNRVNPSAFLQKVKDTLRLAFSTASSAAVCLCP